MATQPGRRRCATCRDWFHPECSALRTQRVCSTECRRPRRRQQAKARREAEPAIHREQERIRQRRRRELQHVTERVSRAGLVPKSPSAKTKSNKIWDKTVTVSRASLDGDLAAIRGGIAQILGHLGHESSDVTRRPPL